jgi:long-subunit acyl-CoA synthetase (AMP-forming)
MWMMCRSSVFKYGEYNALGWRPVEDGAAQGYEWMTYRELDEAVTHAGSALKAAINAGKGTSIGMYAANSSEWMISMKAVDFCGSMTVRTFSKVHEDS